MNITDHSGYGLGQWDNALHTNTPSHWLSLCPEWSEYAHDVALSCLLHALGLCIFVWVASPTVGQWASYQIRKIAGCTCRNTGNVYPHYRGLAIPTCITARASRTCRDACRDRYLAVSFEANGGKNVPGIPGACATRNFTYLVRGAWYGWPSAREVTLKDMDKTNRYLTTNTAMRGHCV